MATAHPQKHKRKRGCDMTIHELRQLEFLNGVQAARYCGMPPRTFYFYLKLLNIPKYSRPTLSNKEKYFYRREDLDEKLRPKSIIQKAQFIQIQEQNLSLTAKKRKALRAQWNAVRQLNGRKERVHLPNSRTEWWLYNELAPNITRTLSCNHKNFGRPCF